MTDSISLNYVSSPAKVSFIAAKICGLVPFLDGKVTKGEFFSNYGVVIMTEIQGHNFRNKEKMDYNSFKSGFAGAYGELAQNYTYADRTEPATIARAAKELEAAKQLAFMEMDYLKEYKNICTLTLKCAFIVAKADGELTDVELDFLREIAARYQLDFDAVAKEYATLYFPLTQEPITYRYSLPEEKSHNSWIGAFG
jgi:hypothetical protein